MSVKEVSDILTEKGFKASEKTIYSWEGGNSQPTPDALLIMCKLYGITDVLAEFGYIQKTDTIAAHKNGETFTPEEIQKIEEYKKLLIAARPKE